MWRRKMKSWRRNVLHVHFHLVRFHFFRPFHFSTRVSTTRQRLPLSLIFLLFFPFSLSVFCSQSRLFLSFPSPPLDLHCPLRDCLSPINREPVQPTILNFLSSTVSHRHSFSPHYCPVCYTTRKWTTRLCIVSRSETLREWNITCYYVAWILHEVTTIFVSLTFFRRNSSQLIFPIYSVYLIYQTLCVEINLI